ncbi:hypothetical protein [Microbacterium invictum]|uniref:Integral membrane protein n=1 Tax=Microbacterium invictum TaxID=515415 RepID=A0AA40VLL8_9MICO|nr:MULTISPECIES: hypothetical protein [Microbacterium]MBB4139516.1 hypothetical protein [Microbacterium invictum]
MSQSAAADADLTVRLAELEAENARLRAGAVTDRALKEPAGTRWRGFFSGLCIVIAAILVPISIVSAWARVQLVDEDAFVSTLAPLVDDPAVQDLVITEAMEAINAQVDFAELTGEVFDGVVDLGVGPRAEAALRLLQQPAADGLQNLVGSAVTTVVESDAFSDVWATTVRGVHRALTLASTSDGGGVVVMTSDGVGIQLAPIIAQVKQNLEERGVGIASLIPVVDRTIIIGSGETLTTIRTAYAIAETAGWWLPVITLALFALGILLARRRSVGILGTGVGLAVGAGALGATLGIGGTAMGMAAAQLDLSPSALDVIYRQLVDDMTQTAWVLALFGVFVAVLGWVMGRSRAARSTRGAVHSLNASARAGLAARGLRTGGFGTWIGAHRVFVRSVIAVLAVLWLFLLRPLSLSEIVLVLVVAFGVAWVLELLQRRDDDAVVAEVHDDASDPEEPTVATGIRA